MNKLLINKLINKIRKQKGGATHFFFLPFLVCFNFMFQMANNNHVILNGRNKWFLCNHHIVEACNFQTNIEYSLMHYYIVSAVFAFGLHTIYAFHFFLSFIWIGPREISQSVVRSEMFLFAFWMMLLLFYREWLLGKINICGAHLYVYESLARTAEPNTELITIFFSTIASAAAAIQLKHYKQKFSMNISACLMMGQEQGAKTSGRLLSIEYTSNNKCLSFCKWLAIVIFGLCFYDAVCVNELVNGFAFVVCHKIK